MDDKPVVNIIEAGQFCKECPNWTPLTRNGTPVMTTAELRVGMCRGSFPEWTGSEYGLYTPFPQTCELDWCRPGRDLMFILAQEKLKASQVPLPPQPRQYSTL